MTVIIDLSEFKAFADDKINVTQKLEVAFDKVKKRSWKRAECWCLRFPQCFPMVSALGVVKSYLLKSTCTYVTY